MSTSPSKQPGSWSAGRRQRAWELHQQGWKQRQIAAALGVSPGAVSQWLKRATLHGPAALQAHPPPGRPPLLSAAQRAQLVALLSQGAEALGFRGAIWTRRRVAQVIREHFGISYHPTHVGRLLRQLDWTVQTPIARATQRDDASVADWYDCRWPA